MPAAPATPSAAVVTSTLHGNIMLITIDNPPVNALSVAVRQGLLDAVERADAEPAVAAILLQGAGKNFIGGADIREFGKPPQAPALPDLCNRIEAASKPVIAVIHGAALGGGLEIALSAHYRLACNDAKIGLPEVLLGLLPGAGGTQRTPRLIGAAAALDLMLSGRHVSAAEAHTLGLVDQVHELDEASDASQAGLDYARQLLAQGAAVRRTRDAQALSDVTATQAALGEARQQTQKKARGLFSPLKIIEAVEAAATLPFDQGLQTERNLFLACLESPQRAGLIHAFFADREVLKAPETRNATSRPINSVGVVGGGGAGRPRLGHGRLDLRVRVHGLLELVAHNVQRLAVDLPLQRLERVGARAHHRDVLRIHLRRLQRVHRRLAGGDHVVVLVHLRQRQLAPLQLEDRRLHVARLFARQRARRRRRRTLLVHVHRLGQRRHVRLLPRNLRNHIHRWLRKREDGGAEGRAEAGWWLRPAEGRAHRAARGGGRSAHLGCHLRRRRYIRLLTTEEIHRQARAEDACACQKRAARWEARVPR